VRKLLIANRGEIACRIILTARRMGIATVAVFSEADAHAPHVLAADEAVAIGPAPARDSYLVADRIIEAARATRADAIHPGYGFLSENADFAEAVRAAGLVFVGPSAEAIRVMGLKDAAKARMRAAGVPIVPGYMGEDQGLARLEQMAVSIGYPLLVKAVAGGGGKGMRPVFDKAGFVEALLAAKREAASAFGNDSVMLEKLIRRPRHVEVQIFGDAHGNIVHLFERDCSLQRRHQKVIEEAPAPGLSDRLRHILGVAAVAAGTAIAYENAGTVEFILDMDELDEAGDPKFYFMEMNTRLQVEHPVTEAITGLDLVEWQLRIARGEMLPLCQEAIEHAGHAVEARLYAETPEAGFLPSTGTLTRLAFPAGVRVDTGVGAGSEVSIHYDPMIAKIIAHAPTRAGALAALVRALDETVVDGVTTNRAFLARLAAHPSFAAGDVHTGFIAEHEAELFACQPAPPGAIAAAAAVVFGGAGAGPGFAAPFRLNLPAYTHGALWGADGTEHRLRLAREAGGLGVWLADGSMVRVDGAPAEPVVHAGGAVLHPVLVPMAQGAEVRIAGHAWRFLAANPAWEGQSAAGPADGSITAPMPGRLLSVHVRVGEAVKAGDRLAVLEAMKMEHRLTAPFDGHIEAVHVAEGAQVAEGDALMTMAPAGPGAQ
jgi:3-methylcrotonyl-CoA carboxylase alpha subunit